VLCVYVVAALLAGAGIARRNPTSLQELKAAVLAAWDEIPDHVVTGLMAGMKGRWEAVVKREGKYTGY
jgi:hypothetical protein